MHSGGPQSLGYSLYSIPDTDTLLKSTNEKGFYTGLGASKDDGLIQRYACLGLDHKCGFEKLKPDFLGISIKKYVFTLTFQIVLGFRNTWGAYF